MKAYTHIYLVSTYSYYATFQSFWCIPNPPAWFYPKLRRLTILDIDVCLRSPTNVVFFIYGDQWHAIAMLPPQSGLGNITQYSPVKEINLLRQAGGLLSRGAEERKLHSPLHRKLPISPAASTNKCLN